MLQKWKMGAIGKRERILFFLAVIFMLTACERDELKHPDYNGGYLFAHMTKDNYGKLFYSLSRDGITWECLNQGNMLFNEYLGHPSIAMGADSTYYMIGVSLDGDVREPILFQTKDLVSWQMDSMDLSIFDVSEYGYENESVYLGAPKIFFDASEALFMITWHAFNRPAWLQKEHWESMRTFYVLTSDWKEFTKARLLFDFSGDDSAMATIDTYIIKDSGRYYAVMKDERWPETDEENGKRIRIAESDNLTGPYSNPSSAISEQYREAPVLVHNIDGEGWLLFIEDYHAHKYELLYTPSLKAQTWTNKKIVPPEGGRHGCIIKIDEKQYQYLKSSMSFNIL